MVNYTLIVYVLKPI